MIELPKNLNKKISTPVGIGIVVLLGLVGGGVLFWQVKTKEIYSPPKISIKREPKKPTPAGKEEISEKPPPHKLEEPTSTEPVTEIDISDWKTYRNKERGFVIKYPGAWEVKTSFKSVVFSKKISNENLNFSLGINIFTDNPIQGCITKGEAVTVEGVRVHPFIFSHNSHSGKGLTETEKCKRVLFDEHSISLDMCFNEELEYLGDHCPSCPDSPYCPEWKKTGYWGDYYQFGLHCEGKGWQGREGMDKCSQLFNWIMSTFKFLEKNG